MSSASASRTVSPESAPVRPLLHARRRPRQVRSHITVTALLDATARLLLTRGYAATSTNLVAEVAGVGIGSLYEYFPNKESLVAALIEREVEARLAALEPVDSREALLSVLATEFPYFEELPVVSRLPAVSGS
jgi:AcrR family transcriptional regulator